LTKIAIVIVYTLTKKPYHHVPTKIPERKRDGFWISPTVAKHSLHRPLRLSTAYNIFQNYPYQRFHNINNAVIHFQISLFSLIFINKIITQEFFLLFFILVSEQSAGRPNKSKYIRYLIKKDVNLIIIIKILKTL